MKINQSYVDLHSTSQSKSIYSREESLQYWVNPELGHKPAETPPNNQGVILTLSEQAKALAAQNNKTEKLNNEDIFELSSEDKMKITLIEKMIEMFTGKKIKLRLPGKDWLKKIKESANPPALDNTSPEQTANPKRQGWGLAYHFQESYFEQQQLSFAARGIIKTADGREISFSVQLQLSREFSSSQSIDLKAGDALIDPLVINLTGQAPGLTQTKYSFDLDSDGQADQISFLLPGSGFLAVDANGDGTINDGRELFGPSTGNGFAELSEYDRDDNDWIDENDPIFKQLRIWTKDSEGNDVLMALGQVGIGAIYLGNIKTNFDLKDPNNELQGQIKKSGIYLNENGTAGTIQQIDLVI